jgi:PPP family 3-phenylpropionic acid transporter
LPPATRAKCNGCPEHSNYRTLYGSRAEACLTSIRYLAAYYFWYFAAIGVSEPYLTPFWRSLGFSSSQLGLLTAIGPAVALFAPFLWGAYADATRQGGRIFLLNTWVAALVALLFPNLRGLFPVGVAVLVYALFRTPLIPLANSMTFRALAGHRQGYAGIRLWGTIGYIVMAVGTGVLVDRIGLRAGMYGIALTMLVCGLVGWQGHSREGFNLSPVPLGGLLQLIRNRQFGLLLCATCLAQVSFGPYTTFFTIHLERLGLSRGFAGTAWALAAGSELLVMLWWQRMCARASAHTWLTVALAAHALRWILSITAHGPGVLLAIQVTHALTFGVFYLAAVQMVDALAPDGLRATAQGVFASVTFGLGGLAGNSLAGLLYEPLGMAWLYAAAAALAASATVLYWTGTRPPVAAGYLPLGHIPGGESR